MRKLIFYEKALWIAIVCLVVSTAYLAYAAQLLSNSVIGEVKESRLQVSLSSSVIYLGESFTLEATLTPATQGNSVTFYWNETNTIGSASTDASSIASISFTPSVSGIYNFTATCNYP
jgi:hypothetical protein